MHWREAVKDLEASELCLVQRRTQIDHVNDKHCHAVGLEQPLDVLEDFHALRAPPVITHLVNGTEEVKLRIREHQIERTPEVLKHVVQVVVNDLQPLTRELSRIGDAKAGATNDPAVVLTATGDYRNVIAGVAATAIEVAHRPVHHFNSTVLPVHPDHGHQ